MADYWKSQARKYCNFCKCWIADNKPSIQYHENGKRHKENVAKKISVLAKQSAKQYKENAKLDEEMKKMEEEALKAYRKDIECSADWTSLEVKRRMEEKKEESRREAEGDDDRKREEKFKTATSIVKELEPVWHEEQTEEGHVYYWNTRTSESRWEPPSEPYVSLKEKKSKESEEKKRSKLEEENRQRQMAEEVKAFQARENMKLKYKKESKAVQEKKETAKVQKETKKTDKKQAPAPQPAQPYGKWTTVVRTDNKPIDFQLPAKPISENKACAMATAASLLAVEEDEEHPHYKIQIEEKTVGSYSTADDEADRHLPGVGGFAFKKRRLNNRGNMRQRLDDDDN